jgi:rhodanese-related sulfurtransferase
MTIHDNISIDLASARAAFESGKAVLIDIREPHEHAMGVAPGATLIPMSELGARLDEVPAAPETPVLVICHTQNRSASVVNALRERGYAHVRYVIGGMASWRVQGWPLAKP